MAHPELTKVFKLVEERTGYPVSVVGDPSLDTMAGMRAATAAAPVHLVKVNPDYEQVGNYLIALQCAMLLVKWHNPNASLTSCPTKTKSGTSRAKLPLASAG